MISFENDYSEGCLPEILQALAKTNLEQVPGYGSDKFCDSAKEKIKKAIKAQRADIFFIAGGTETNQLVISTVLDQYQGVLSANTGHVNCHEAGAIEATGHKVLPLPSYEGKIKACDIQKWLNDFYSDSSHDHMVFPGMVYISQPTEYGTLYTKSELTEISDLCRKEKLPLYVDGARLAYGLESEKNDVSLEDLARLADIFYIGGTKCGAIIGEALVFPNGNAPSHFITRIKRQGDMLAKARLLGIQFDCLFTDNLYQKAGRHGIESAKKLRKIFEDAGYKFFIDSPTNQQFLIIENSRLKKIGEKIRFSFWEKYDENHTVVRFATSWATSEENLCELNKVIKEVA